MKTPKILFILLACVCLSWAALATDPVPTVHWYTVTVNKGDGTEKITGCSSLNADQLNNWISEPNPRSVRLEKIRAYYPVDTRLGWHENPEVSALFILPKHIVYFCELVAEPKLADQ